MKTTRHPDLEPAHPADLVADEITTRRVSKVALAKALDVARRTLYDLLEKRAGCPLRWLSGWKPCLGPRPNSGEHAGRS